MIWPEQANSSPFGFKNRVSVIKFEEECWSPAFSICCIEMKEESSKDRRSWEVSCTSTKASHWFPFLRLGAPTQRYKALYTSAFDLSIALSPVERGSCWCFLHRLLKSSCPRIALKRSVFFAEEWLRIGWLSRDSHVLNPWMWDKVLIGQPLM